MLSSWMEPQIRYLLMLQNFRELTNGVFDDFFMSLTSLGELVIPVSVAAGVYWCINSKHGMYLLWSLGLGMFFSQLLKIAACVYRPWILDPKIHPIPAAMGYADGYSFPSGHTQIAVNVWGGLAVCYKNKILRILLILLVLLIGFSRNYAGVHTPQDVAASLLAGGLILYFTQKLMKWSEYGKNRDIIIFCGIVALSVILVLYGYFKTYPLDYVDGKLLADPVKMKTYCMPAAGFLTGIFSGWILNKRFLGFDGSSGSIAEKFLRFAAGYFVLSLILTKSVSMLTPLMPKECAITIMAFLATVFITYIYPLIIVTLKKNHSFFDSDTGI